MNNEQAAEILQDIFQHAVNSARAGPVTRLTCRKNLAAVVW